ncbi:NUDIX domain protein [Mycobacterium kansasii]|uniref:NUDIX domain protein n=1 Tax=Mycobacterium kansasii TaxID=1768 RepID=A0A1V3XSS9_MYCKA|nr:NUDIX domain protein [Mycobacterium kansasii]
MLDASGTQVLLCLHRRFGRWVQLGGHCEEADRDVVAAALREATEESGISGLRLAPELVAVHVHPVTCSLGVPTRHLDLQFVAHAPAGRRSRSARSPRTCGGGRPRSYRPEPTTRWRTW